MNQPEEKDIPLSVLTVPDFESVMPSEIRETGQRLSVEKHRERERSILSRERERELFFPSLWNLRQRREKEED